MSDESLIEESITAPLPPARPVFSRPIQTPPGLPWDQRRVAELEARAGSPVTDPMIHIVVTRRTPWRPRQPGLFEAEYLRPAPKVVRPFEPQPPRGLPAWAVKADGSLAPWLLPAASVFLAVSIFGLAIVVGNARQASETRALTDLDAELGSLQEAIRTAAQASRSARALEASGLPQSDLASALGDLGWLARSRAPEAQVQEVQWRRGVMTVRFRAPGQSFEAVDRAVSADASDATGRTWRIDPRPSQPSSPRAAGLDSLPAPPMPGAGR